MYLEFVKDLGALVDGLLDRVLHPHELVDRLRVPRLSLGLDALLPRILLIGDAVEIVSSAGFVHLWQGNKTTHLVSKPFLASVRASTSRLHAELTFVQRSALLFSSH